MNGSTVILQLICPDRSALVSELAGWVAANGGNIRHADHHTDSGAGLFLSRILSSTTDCSEVKLSVLLSRDLGALFNVIFDPKIGIPLSSLGDIDSYFT